MASFPKESAWPGKSAALPRDPPPDWLEEILGGGHGLILLDGLDELGSTGRDLARDTLRIDPARPPRQPGGAHFTPGRFRGRLVRGCATSVTTIRAMSPAQREACISNWHEAVAQAKPGDAEPSAIWGAI